jgi:hypothetical protein
LVCPAMQYRQYRTESQELHRNYDYDPPAPPEPSIHCY